MEKTTEEKAKLYDAALERAEETLRSLAEDYQYKGTLTKEKIKEIYGRYFPELREPYPQKMKRKIVSYLESLQRSSLSDEQIEELEECIRWVENQKEETKKEMSKGDNEAISCAIFWLMRKLTDEDAKDISTRACPLSIKETLERLTKIGNYIPVVHGKP